MCQAHSSTSSISKGRHGMTWKVKARQGMTRQGMEWHDMERKGKARNEKLRCVPMVLLKMKNDMDGTRSVGWKFFFPEIKIKLI
jgi:hypothetical protein